MHWMHIVFIGHAFKSLYIVIISGIVYLHSLIYRHIHMTTYTLDYGTATASDLAWWISYGLKRIAIAESELNHNEITQEQFDTVVDTHTKQVEEFAKVGYII